MTGWFRSLLENASSSWADRRIRHHRSLTPVETLADLLRTAAETRYGRQYHFADLLRADDLYRAYRDQVPIIDYTDWTEWLGDLSPVQCAVPLHNEAWPGTIDVFCLSSGTTTGRTRYIPYSREMAAVNRQTAIDFYAHIIRDDPSLTPASAKALYMTGSTSISRNAEGALCGDMSGLTKFLSPFFLEWVTLPPRSISSLEPWSVRLSALTDLCLKERDEIGILSGIPIWQLTLLENLARQTGNVVGETMSRLKVLIHGGMSVAPYRQKILDVFGGDLRFLEIYAASEIGIGAFQIPGEDGMRFCHGYKVFYEFESPDGKLVEEAGLEPGVAYALIISSCSGLWRYRIGDRVVFRSTDPLILDYVTRDKTTSAFDEKVTEKEIENAVTVAGQITPDFAMGPDTGRRRHTWFLITDQEPDAAWIKRLDDSLRANNQDYDDYRGDGRIADPVLVCISERAAFLKTLNRVEGGQRKFPRLLSPEEVATLLERHHAGTH